ncbi:MAG TPA: hypothetical protein VF498_15930 [Anaerolineales bacterium]
MEWPVLLADWLLLGFYGAAILGLAALAGRFVFWRGASGPSSRSA